MSEQVPAEPVAQTVSEAQPVSTAQTIEGSATGGAADAVLSDVKTGASDVVKVAEAVDPSVVAHVKAEIDKVREEVWAELAKLRARVGG